MKISFPLLTIVLVTVSVLTLCGFCILKSKSKKGGPLELHKIIDSFKSGRCSKSTDCFREIPQNLKEDEKAAVVLAKGLIYEHRRPEPDFTAAINEYNTVIEKFPDTPSAPAAILYKGRCMELDRNSINPGEAQNIYRKLIGKYPKSPEAKEAEIRLGMSYICTMKKDEAIKGIKILENYLRKNPGDPENAGIYVIIGGAYADIVGNRKRALAELLKADREGIKSYSMRADNIFAAASLAQETGDKKTASRCYRKFMKEFSSDPRCFHAEKQLQKMGIKP